MATIRVLIAEDEGALRGALTDLVDSDPEMEVVATAADADQAIEEATRTQPDIALVDVKMPGGGGPRATREIMSTSPGTRVVALSAYEDRRTVLEMLRAGVVGYLVKGTPAGEIIRTIRRSVRGEGSLSVEITADVIRELAELLERSELLAEQLQELNRTKSDLIQILSHELFTPITTIQGFAMTVAERGNQLSPEQVRELANGVERASHRLRRLVGNLSASASLDRDGVEVTTRPVPVGDLVRSASTSFTGETYKLTLPDDPALLARRVWADPDLAAQALVIVLENAFEFGDPAHPVTVAIHGDKGQLRVAVSDQGHGIPESQRDQIFEAFVQADAGSTRTHEGLGIGLYLARRIMLAHGGNISVGDGAEGGTTVTLTFAGLDDDAQA